MFLNFFLRAFIVSLLTAGVNIYAVYISFASGSVVGLCIDELFRLLIDFLNPFLTFVGVELVGSNSQNLNFWLIGGLIFLFHLAFLTVFFYFRSLDRVDDYNERKILKWGFIGFFAALFLMSFDLIRMYFSFQVWQQCGAMFS